MGRPQCRFAYAGEDTTFPSVWYTQEREPAGKKLPSLNNSIEDLCL
jgi:hypothetical protein